MKKLFVFALTLISLFTMSCDKAETPTPETTPDSSEITFLGRLQSIDSKGATFTQEGQVKFKVINNGTDNVTLLMYKPQFAAAMPAMFDMEVGGISRKVVESISNLSGTDLIPKIGIKPYPTYKMTDLKGTISANGENLVVEFKCVGYTATYVGSISGNIPDPKPTDKTFAGTLSSVSATGEVFTQKEVVEFKVINIATDSTTLWMYKPKFTDKMPAMFDMKVPGIISAHSDATTTLSGTDLIPYVNNKPFSQFIMTALKGSISDNGTKLSIEFKCMGSTITYVGEIKK